jgi:hypothetical protein
VRRAHHGAAEIGHQLLYLVAVVPPTADGQGDAEHQVEVRSPRLEGVDHLCEERVDHSDVVAGAGLVEASVADPLHPGVVRHGPSLSPEETAALEIQGGR